MKMPRPTRRSERHGNCPRTRQKRTRLAAAPSAWPRVAPPRYRSRWCGTATSLVQLIESLTGRSNVNAASDLDVAALLAQAAARGAGANVIINLPSVEDPRYAGTLLADLEGRLHEIESIVAGVHSRVAREACAGRRRRDSAECPVAVATAEDGTTEVHGADPPRRTIAADIRS